MQTSLKSLSMRACVRACAFFFFDGVVGHILWHAERIVSVLKDEQPLNISPSLPSEYEASPFIPASLLAKIQSCRTPVKISLLLSSMKRVSSLFIKPQAFWEGTRTLIRGTRFRWFTNYQISERFETSGLQTPTNVFTSTHPWSETRFSCPRVGGRVRNMARQ